LKAAPEVIHLLDERRHPLMTAASTTEFAVHTSSGSRSATSSSTARACEHSARRWTRTPPHPEASSASPQRPADGRPGRQLLPRRSGGFLLGDRPPHWKTIAAVLDEIRRPLGLRCSGTACVQTRWTRSPSITLPARRLTAALDLPPRAE
jgi:hypothetical protein